MAKVKSYGFSDTPIPGVSEPLSFLKGLVNFKSDFRVKSNTNGEVILTNITSPVDRPEKIRIAYSDISDVYKGSGVEATVSAPSKRGTSVLLQVTEVIQVTDSTDPDFRIDLPVSYHMVIKVPTSEYITPDVIQTGIGRLLSSLFDTGSDSVARLDAILRGSLVPADL